MWVEILEALWTIVGGSWGGWAIGKEIHTAIERRRHKRRREKIEEELAYGRTGPSVLTDWELARGPVLAQREDGRRRWCRSRAEARRFVDGK